jgi:S-adenosylmethionine/arginine decarboxylase-like enzyme
MTKTTTREIVTTTSGRMKEPNKGRSNVQTTGNAQAATISPFVFLVSLLLGAGLFYNAGTMYKNHWITAPDAPRHESLSKQEKLLEAARYQRGMINVVPSTSTCENECPATQELTIEQVFFPEGGYSQYDEDDDDDEEDDEDDDHYVQFYAAQLIMDVQRLDSDFLMDASRIRQAIFETIWEASKNRDLAISSVHCQKSIGVTCVAVLADGNHMTVSTNPEHHFCTLDLYFADDRHLLEVVPILEKNFGVGQKSRARFRHLFRGQRTALLEGFTWSAFEQDLTDELLDIKDQFFYKKEVSRDASVQPSVYSQLC